MKTNSASTYDYKRQAWVSGSQGDSLRRQQVVKELELLRGVRGEEYAKFIGVDRQAAVRRLEREQSALR